MATSILSLKNVNKSFGPIDVLNDISIDIKAGEVLCLLGDNGAGKSTLIRILSGVHQPTSGTILFEGQPITFPTPKAAAEQGIATVHQFGGTFPLMSIGRSFFIGVEPKKDWGPFKVFDRKKANEIAVRAVRDFGITRIDDGDRLVGWGAPVVGHCSCRSFRRESPHSRRAYDRPRRQAGDPRSPDRQRGETPWPGGRVHHAPGDARHGSRGSLRSPDPRCSGGRLPEGRENSGTNHRSDGWWGDHGRPRGSDRRCHAERRPSLRDRMTSFVEPED